jgi:hypothetical protein
VVGINDILLVGALAAGIVAVIAFLVIRPQAAVPEPITDDRERTLAAAPTAGR